MDNGLNAPPLSARARMRGALPFITVTLIWSSTWLVIRTQLGDVPPAWSVTYRFAIAAVLMTGYAARTGTTLRLTARQHGLALFYGIAQYALNYYAVYVAEEAITSGLVAVVFALLVVPNAIFGWLFLKQGLSRPFLMGSTVAMGGLALLFSHELHSAPTARGHILIGIGWSLTGVLFASIANIVPATARGRELPVVSLVAWGMIWGALFDGLAAFVTAGPPVFVPSPLYWFGTLYLALIGSALAFTLYFGMVRTIGPARAAYTSVLTPVIAMGLSTIFEGYRWSPTAAAGAALALAGLVIALRAKAR